MEKYLRTKNCYFEMSSFWQVKVCLCTQPDSQLFLNCQIFIANLKVLVNISIVSIKTEIAY